MLLDQTGDDSKKETRRQRILETPVGLLPLSSEAKKILLAMGFITLGRAFRACLMGRVSTREKDREFVEEEVLTACGQLLGHPPMDRSYFKNCLPRDDQETVGQALWKLYGEQIQLPEGFVSRSIREILFPTGIHNIIGRLQIDTIGQLLTRRLAELLSSPGIGPKLLGDLLALTFDYLFIKHDPAPSFLEPKVEIPIPVTSEVGLDNGDLLLSPWFSREVLLAGKTLLVENRLKKSFFSRTGVGALFRDEKQGHVSLKFERAPRLATGFMIHHPRCYICGLGGKDRGFCQHAAALAMHSLQRTEGERDKKFWPLPFIFEESPWKLIGVYLFEYLGKKGFDWLTLRRAGDRAWWMTVKDREGNRIFSWWLEHETLRECVSIFREGDYGFGVTLVEERDEDIYDLYARLGARCRTRIEIEFNAEGKRSRAQERNESLWLWIARVLFRTVSASRLRIKRRETDGLFELYAVGESDGNCEFFIVLERAGTAAIVMTLGRLGVGMSPLPAARAFTRVRMDDTDASLVVSPCVRLADGRTFSRQELEPIRYGKGYWFEGEGFCMVREQTVESAGGETHYSNRRISADEVPAFIVNHKAVISAPENEVDEVLGSFEVYNSPDQLDITQGFMKDGWWHVAGHFRFSGQDVSFDDLYDAKAAGREFLPGKGGWIQLDGEPLAWFFDLPPNRRWTDPATGRSGIRLDPQELFRLHALGPKLVFPTGSRPQTTEIKQFLRFDPRKGALDTPAGIPGHLREYQKNGVAWLWFLYGNGLGGILADDMGLGKTHQALGLFSAIKATPAFRRILVVCPTTVVSHWTEKIEQFYPGLSWYVYHGNKRDLEEARNRFLLITTYGILRRDIDELAAMEFDVVLLDEIQYIKNKKTDVHRAVRQLAGRVMIGLSGTPLENSVCDLKSLLDVCVPGFLGTDAWFKRRFIGPIEDCRDKAARHLLSRLISPFFLRRTRTQVLNELPDIIEDVRYCELSAEQEALYRDVLHNRGEALLERLSAERRENHLPYMEILAVITLLKQICDHPSLVVDKADKAAESSGKWELFQELLETCLENQMKVVVFSHYTRMLDIIQAYLKKAGISHGSLRGDMSMTRRQEMISRFNTDPSCLVFCASLLAGGVGIDLTGAQAVIHYDRWWNAAREDQATARVHRMGQKHVVQVFKLVTRDSVEEKIHRLIEKKRQLADELIREDDAGIIKRLTRKEILEILQWDKGPGRP